MPADTRQGLQKGATGHKKASPGKDKANICLYISAFVGQMTEIVFKALCEVRRRREAYVVGYFRHGLRRCAEQMLGSLKSGDAYYLDRRRACNLLHLAIELHTAKAKLGGKSLNVEFRVGQMPLETMPEVVNKTCVGVVGRRFFLFCVDARIYVLQLHALVEQIAHTRQQDVAAERLGDVGVGTAVVALGTLVVEGLCREQYHGYVARCRLRLQAPAHL